MNHETMTALLVVTNHVTQEEAKIFDDANAPGKEMGGPMVWEFGWMIYIGSKGNFTDMDAFSEGLRQVIEYAWAHQLQWVRFDEAGPKLDGCVTYDW